MRLDLPAIRAYADDYEDRELPPCVHGREPVDRCDQCTGLAVNALCDRVEQLEAALRDVLPLAKRACGEHPSDEWRTYDAAKAALEGD